MTRTQPQAAMPAPTPAAPQAARPPVSPLIQKCFLASMWAFIVYAVAIMGIVKPILITGIDYDKHWFAARALMEGRSVYLGPPLWMGFNYPQATAFAYAWLGLFSVTAGEYAYKLSLLLLLLGCWWLAWRRFRPCPAAEFGAAPAGGLAALTRAGMARHWGPTTAFLIATFYPATTCVYVGNIDPLCAFFALGMAGALLTGAPLAAGVCWALLTLVKMVPLALIVPLLFWRQWRVIKGFLIVMAAYFILLVATGRVGQEWFFVHECMPKIPAYWRSITLAPFTALLRLTHWSPYFHDADAFNRVLFWNTLVLTSLYLLLNAVMVRRRFGPWRALEGAFVYLPLLTPLLEYHHYVWIMPVMFLQARRWVLGGMSAATALALCASYAMLDAGYQLLDLLPRAEGWTEAIHFVPLPGYLAVLGVTLADVLRGRGWERLEGSATEASIAKAAGLPEPAKSVN